MFAPMVSTRASAPPPVPYRFAKLKRRNTSIYIGITERDAGNKEVIAIPVDVAFQATPMLAVGLGTRFAGPLDGFGDFNIGSLDIFGHYTVNAMIDVFLRFSFANLYGTGGGADARVLTIGANIRI